ncbi:hypothetical protein Noc_1477 [Nitrosococcus oceani ATCC 19707]|uniref:Uncharacterized protein n=2 Tax=Nitrosococcus oceani TaxID=1229 RepID=Q3JB33_NITOC|nr:hypothetical protein [Nitrosococcus oceani]ABA57963.1 hypothetical protein Noc_1477 [Nitrosococcus oceani ATCC 19707]EDZ67359.1 hypothetical protein NOC27_686 [Nitrosococcus oceani AFC27]KFI19692.1 hypothetical protein IB75_07750 [Nitrosococcus oceani C-27]GEM19610.1 hypothetical protein NONS58_10020 [Nitrosococcus oceani]
MGTRHTFLFEPAVWEAEGTFFDAAGHALRLEGEMQVTHATRGWHSEGRMRVLSEPPLVIENRYDIIPFAPGRDTTSWISMNPVLGKLSGRFVLVGEMILSLFESKMGEHKGMEVLVKQDDGCYLGRGTVLARGGKVSSWAITLRRQREALG